LAVPPAYPTNTMRARPLRSCKRFSLSLTHYHHTASVDRRSYSDPRQNATIDAGKCLHVAIQEISEIDRGVYAKQVDLSAGHVPATA
jgi:hypothetical protein